MENARISFFATSLDADNVENVIQIRERETKTDDSCIGYQWKKAI